MKKILVLLLFVTLQTQAGNIRTIRAEPTATGYTLSIWGRIEGGFQEDIKIKDLGEIAKITGIEQLAEFGVPVKPQRFWIHFADGSNPDQVVGTVDKIDFHSVEAKEFVQRIITPTAAQSKTAIADLKTLVESKPTDGK